MTQEFNNGLNRRCVWELKSKAMIQERGADGIGSSSTTIVKFSGSSSSRRKNVGACVNS